MRRLWLVALATGLAGCTSQLKESSFVIQNIIAGVTDLSGTIHGTLTAGTAPDPNGGPSATVSGFAAMVNGGSAQINLTGSTSFTRVIVSVAGIANYYVIDLPAGTSNEVVIQAAPQLSNGTYPIQYAVGDASVRGSYTTQNVRVIGVGTGDIQVSVAWNDSSDVDLHVWDPSNEEIYFANTQSASGGDLDLDSNAACTRDSNGLYNSNENIVWPYGVAPSGQYVVKLHHWSRCGISTNTDWLVTVQRTGAAPMIFSGTFAASDTTSWANITNFTY